MRRRLQGWSRGQKARGQGQEHKKNPRPRPRTKDRCGDQVFSTTRSLKFFFWRSPKKGFQKILSGDIQKRKTKKVFANFSRGFSAFSNKILTVQKLVLSSSRGQGNFRGLEASRPRPSTVAHAGFSKGGPENSRKFQNNRDQNKNFPAQKKSVFLPKIR